MRTRKASALTPAANLCSRRTRKGGVHMQDYNPIYNLLRSDGSIVVNKNLIFALGLHEAIVYAELVSRFIYFADRNELTVDGYFFNTIEDLYSGTGLGEKPQRTAINNLRKLGLIGVKVQGVPPKRYFTIIDNQELLVNLLRKGKEKQAQIRSTSKFLPMGGINFSQTAESISPYGRTNNTNSNKTKPIILNTYKGASPGGECSTPLSFPLFCKQFSVDGDVIDSVEYYLHCYRRYMGKEHPNLKPEQWQRVIDNWFVGYDEIYNRELDLSFDPEYMELVIEKHFRTQYRNCDYNILHFITNGVKVRRMYEEAY